MTLDYPEISRNIVYCINLADFRDIFQQTLIDNRYITKPTIDQIFAYTLIDPSIYRRGIHCY